VELVLLEAVVELALTVAATVAQELLLERLEPTIRVAAAVLAGSLVLMTRALMAAPALSSSRFQTPSALNSPAA
jgi:hypothetical protein